MTAPPQRLLDVGAQAERTALAWQRTGLAAVGVGALLFHLVGAESVLASIAGVAAVLGGAVGAGIVAPVRYRRIVTSVEFGRSPLSSRFCGTVGLALVAIGVMATGAVLQAPLR